MAAKQRKRPPSSVHVPPRRRKVTAIGRVPERCNDIDTTYETVIAANLRVGYDQTDCDPTLVNTLAMAAFNVVAAANCCKQHYLRQVDKLCCAAMFFAADTMDRQRNQIRQDGNSN